MEQTLQDLEQEAYFAVMLVMASTPLDWNKERLLTDLRQELHISGDDHRKVLEEVHHDDRVQAIRRQLAEEQGPSGRSRQATGVSPPQPLAAAPSQHGSGRGLGRPARASMDGGQVKRGPGRPPSIKTSDSFREPERRGPGRPPGSGRPPVPTPSQPVSPGSARGGRQKRPPTFFDEGHPTPVTPFAPPVKSPRIAEKMAEEAELLRHGSIASRGGGRGSRGTGRGKHMRRGSTASQAAAASQLGTLPSNLSHQLAAQPPKATTKMQRVPFVPDLLDLVLPTSSVEELEIMLQQLSARESDIQIEMQIAKRLQEDIPDHSEVCRLQLQDLTARQKAVEAEMADNLLLEELLT